MQDSTDLGDADVMDYERRLRRAAIGRASETQDADLLHIFRRVHDRRSQRSRSPRGRSIGEHASPETAGPPGTVLSVVEVAPTVRIFRIRRPPGLRFQAGQYLKVGVQGGKKQDFSIASAPHEEAVELCVELIPGGRVTPALFALRPGDTVELGPEAKGKFRLDEDALRHLMVATVTGIAPLRSMLRDALHRGIGEEIIVLHGASYADELPYRDELAELAAADPRVRYTPTVSRPNEARNRAWRGARGRVDALATLVAESLDPRTTHAYACGNAGMVSNVSRALRDIGFQVSTETFD